jgi:hypothetical protein
MTIDEAIKHCEEVAEEQENKAKVLNGDFYQSRRNDCLECAEEHRQLAEWLKELKAYREIIEQWKHDQISDFYVL